MSNRASYVIFRRNPLYTKCPSCEDVNTLHRSRDRGFKEKFIKTFSFFKIYRCSKCGWRGYLSTLTITSRSFKNLAMYLAIIIITALIVREIIKRFI